MNRPPKLLWPAARVLKGVPVKVLAAGLKLVWLECHGLDNGPEGCWASAGTLAERLGTSREAVEVCRRELVRMGLLVKLPTRRGATAGWVPTLPADAIPNGRTPKPAEVNACVRRLTAYLTSGVLEPATEEAAVRHSPVPQYATPDGRMAYPRTPLPDQSSGTDGVSGYAGLEKVGEILQHQVGVTPTSEVGEILQPGEQFAHNEKAEEQTATRGSLRSPGDESGEPKPLDVKRLMADVARLTGERPR